MRLTDHIDHRPIPMPDRPWALRMSWTEFLFLHWAVDPDVLRRCVPDDLELDRFDGTAYLGVIPFVMTGVHPRGTFDVPGLSAFPELNVRTYVTVDGRPGVYFLSLEAHSPVAVEIARSLWGLNYLNADMAMTVQDRTRHYRSIRTDGRGPAARFEGRYTPRGDYFLAERGTLRHWLSERYCLYVADERGVRRTDVHHLPWPMREVDVAIETNTMAESHGIVLPDEPPLAMYSPGVDVVAWTPQSTTG